MMGRSAALKERIRLRLVGVLSTIKQQDADGIPVKANDSLSRQKNTT